jgi:uncharacterized protein YjbI with pentapeptide repeats
MPDPAAAPAAPRLPEEPVAGRIRSLAHDSVLGEVELRALDLSNQDARGVKLDGVRAEECDLSSSRLDALRLVDCVLHGCDLANVLARGAALSRVEVLDSRLTGISLLEANLADVTFRGCRADLASLAGASLTRVTFEDCVLVETGFVEARLQSVRFLHCDLTAADFRDARVEGCEFRRNRLSAVQGLTSLRGAAMEWPDVVELAGELASALGIDTLDGPAEGTGAG